MRSSTFLLSLLFTCVACFRTLLRPPCHQHHVGPTAVPAFSGMISSPSVHMMCSADGGKADGEATEAEVVDEAAEAATADAQGKEEAEEEEDLLSTPAFLKQKLKVLEKELADVQAQTAMAKAEASELSTEWEQKRTRLQTDFDNFKARHVNQTLEAQLDVRIEVLKQFLPVLDNFDRARASIRPEGAAQEATNAHYTKMHAGLMATLGELGMKKIEAVGTEFDYNLHMAIQQMPSDEYASGIVCTEMQPGFTCQGKLLRAAYVAVAI